MKWHIFPLILFSLIFISCGDEENLNFEAYNTEAFVFDTGDEYEVNASVRLKGFKIEEEGGKFTSSVAYDVDLVKPDGSKEESFISKIEDFEFDEEVRDAGLDIQFSLDTSSTPGKYTIILRLTDVYTDNATTASAEFQLTD